MFLCHHPPPGLATDGSDRPDHVITLQQPKLQQRLSVYHLKDIGNFMNNKHITADKLDVINSLWVPPSTYTFPLLDKYNDQKVKLRFQHKWLIEFNWLSYSAKEKGAFCKFCVFFATTGGVNSQTLGAFIFNSHQSTQFHKESICAYENLAKIQEGVQESVLDLIDENRKKQVAQNRAKIKLIIEAVLVCGREEMSFRHRDSGELKIDDSSANEGKFRAILKYRARGEAA
ncbi:hypothetical protein NQ315_017222 [Exocentrus adspersus]|uniref:TTF-type domain-containing protein n=1 Tax=Exocentrus adspersus TaxID=1586481 RepID=A0AAV8V6Z2_9CUCU|nr:hypothetical protein NQ315_017222 [Exocentrus adspersus]